MQSNLKMVVVSHLTFNIYHLSFCERKPFGSRLIVLSLNKIKFQIHTFVK